MFFCLTRYAPGDTQNFLEMKHSQPQKQIYEMCCFCAMTNLVAWVRISFNDRHIV